MSLEIRRIGQDERPFLNALIYGMPGVGKTTLAAQAQSHPDLSPVLVADLEGGLLSVASRGDIDAVAIRTTDEMDELFWALRNQTIRNAEGDLYRTVIIDSGTNLANRALEEWVARNSERAIKKGRGDKDRTLDDVQIEDYGKMGLQVRRLMTWYRDLPLNVIVTALARFEYPKDADAKSADPISVGPDFTAKLASNVAGMMDHVWYMYSDHDGRHMLTQEMGVYRAKTRGANFSEAIGYVVDSPNLVDLYEILVKTETSGDFVTPPELLEDVPYDVESQDDPLPEARDESDPYATYVE